MAVGDCSVTERRGWRPPYQTGKTVHVHAKHYKHNEDGRTAPGVCGNGSVLLSHSGNVVMRIGIHTHERLCWTDARCPVEIINSFLVKLNTQIYNFFSYILYIHFETVERLCWTDAWHPAPWGGGGVERLLDGCTAPCTVAMDTFW